MKGGVSRADERTITVKFEVLKDTAITEAHGDADIEQAILEAELSDGASVSRQTGDEEASSGEESCKACPSQEGGKKACARQEGHRGGAPARKCRPAALTCLRSAAAVMFPVQPWSPLSVEVSPPLPQHWPPLIQRWRYQLPALPPESRRGSLVRWTGYLLAAPAASCSRRLRPPEEGEMPFDEVLDAVGDDGAREMFVGDVIDASGRSNFDPKLIALGWALAKGVLTQDEAVFQQEVNFVRTLARLEAPHIRVLQVIGESLPQPTRDHQPRPDPWMGSLGHSRSGPRVRRVRGAACRSARERGSNPGRSHRPGAGSAVLDHRQRS